MTPSRLQHFAVSFSLYLLTFCALSGHAFAASDPKEPAPEACAVIHSPSSNSKFDLNKIVKHKPTEKDFKQHDDGWEATSYHVKGHDYGANFTMNFCAPVIETLKDVVGVDEDSWERVAMFYTKGGETYSLGEQNSEPMFRGRKLILNYTNGSPCPDPPEALSGRHATSLRSGTHKSVHAKPVAGKKHRSLLRHEASEIELDKQRAAHKSVLEDDDEEDHESFYTTSPKESTLKAPVRRKNAILSLMCERDVVAAARHAAVSFVGTNDECSYFFEVRTHAACAGVEVPDQSLGPSSVFGVIVLIAVLVYLIGGCVYQRTVMHQRGWRQIPNYAMWSSCWGGFTDCFVIATSSCARLLPRRNGYSRVSNMPNGYGRGRHNHTHSDDENRLIDQLDEEWDD